MIPVDSSNLTSVGYSYKDRTLRIRFRGGGLYEYADVPDSVYVQLLSESDIDGGSVGRAFHRLVKGKYEFRVGC